MVFPLTVGPGETGFLANPDQAKYFFWEGKATSAHYYVNHQGVAEGEACTWGVDGRGKGNWGPVIFGTSWDDINMNMGFSSLKQNELNKNEPLDYSITFEGDNVISPCRYIKSTDQYCQADECWYDRGRSCTVSRTECLDQTMLIFYLLRLPSNLTASSPWFLLTIRNHHGP